MPTHFRIVTTPKLTANDKMSFGFMFESNMPREWIRNEEASHWGFVLSRRRAENEINLAELVKSMRGEPHGQTVGDDGTDRWNVQIFNSGHGFILSGGVDDNPMLHVSLAQMFLDLPPHVVLCMSHADFDRIDPALRTAGFTTEVHHSDVELRTA